MSSVLKDWLALGDALTELVAALVALANYWHQTRTKKAKFLLTLHKSFLVEEFYKGIRDQIDGGSYEEIAALVKEESPAFTDFLNFFELVAYMGKQGTLSAVISTPCWATTCRSFAGTPRSRGTSQIPKMASSTSTIWSGAG